MRFRWGQRSRFWSFFFPFSFLKLGGLAGGFNFFLIFTPKIGEDFQFDEHIFQMGWFNHQPEDFFFNCGWGHTPEFFSQLAKTKSQTFAEFHDSEPSVRLKTGLSSCVQLPGSFSGSEGWGTIHSKRDGWKGAIGFFRTDFW